MKSLAAAAALAAFLLATPPPAGAQPIPSGVTVGVPAVIPAGAPAVNDTLRALDRLHRMGYVINSPARAERAIRAWQRSNGLTPDGLVGPKVLGSLGLVATASVPAVRTTPPPAPAPAGDVCTEMSVYREAAGLPEVFDAIGFRESRCHNEVGNACCHGYWANYLSSHLSSRSQYRQRIIDECGVSTVADIRGTSDAQKRASACVTFVVWSISGMSPWGLP